MANGKRPAGNSHVVPFFENFATDVFKRPSVGPFAGWLVAGLVALVVFLTIEYAPGAAGRATQIPGSDVSGVIPAWAGLLTLSLVAVLSVIAGVEHIVGPRLESWWENRITPRLAPHGRVSQAVFSFLRYGIGYPLWLIFRIPSSLLSFLDAVFVRVFAVLVGVTLQSWKFRYGVMLGLVLAATIAGWALPPPWGLIACVAGIVVILAVARRWQWIERDREAFLVERKQPEHMRIGFDEDLRDEALIAIVFLFVLIPLGLRQADLTFVETFKLVEGAAPPEAWYGELLMWLDFFGGELTKAVPLFDWSEVYHVINGSSLRPGSELGVQTVFAVRVALDLLLIAALLQAVRIAARLRDQETAFKSGALTVLDPFAEQRHFEQVSRQSEALPFADPHTIPREVQSEELSRTYDKDRLCQITSGRDEHGVPERSKIILPRAAQARSAAVLTLWRQHGKDRQTLSAFEDWLKHDHDLSSPLIARRAGRIAQLLARQRSESAAGAIRRLLGALPADAHPQAVMNLAAAAAQFETGSPEDRAGAVGALMPEPLRALAGMALIHGLEEAPGDFIRVEAGASFHMGSKVRHPVTFAKSFAMARFTVTFDDYDAFCRATGRRLVTDFGWGRGQRPAVAVSQEDAMAFCAWLSELTGTEYRLPSEAEWEYCCRAGSDDAYTFGDDPESLAEYGWYRTNSGRQTQQVGLLKPNRFGLYDMHGNVWEWCRDDWHDSYDMAGRPDDGSPWITGDTLLTVLRGGCWVVDAQGCGSTSRDANVRVSRGFVIGFRLARTL